MYCFNLLPHLIVDKGCSKSDIRQIFVWLKKSYRDYISGQSNWFMSVNV